MTSPTNMEVRDYPASLIRTLVPMWIGTGIAWLNNHIGPIDVPAGTDIMLAAAAASFYYGIVRKAEQSWPKLGWFLGLKAEVKYQKPPAPVL